VGSSVNAQEIDSTGFSRFPRRVLAGGLAANRGFSGLFQNGIDPYPDW